MRNVITMLLLCVAVTAQAQTSTTVVMPDGTMLVCTTIGTIVTCTQI